MPNYKVHVFVGIRIPIGVEAEDMADACKVAEERLDVDSHLDHSRPIEWQAESEDELQEFLIDPALPSGAWDHDNSQWFDRNYEPNN